MRTGNQLIQLLPHDERDRLVRCCEFMDLIPDAILHSPKVPYEHVYFPLTGCISLAVLADPHPPLGVAFIGNEGMLGATALLDERVSSLCGRVQLGGTALRMSTADLASNLRRSSALGHGLHRYLLAFVNELAQGATCARFHDVAERLARLFLMMHDRASGNDFHATHQSIADLLGVRRSAVSIAAGALQRQRMLRYSRGTVTILSRKGLIDAACHCYRSRHEPATGSRPGWDA